MERQYVEYTVRENIVKVGLLHSPISSTDAYLIGRIAADGAYTFTKEKHFVRMGISAKDMNFLDSVSKEYMPNTLPTSRDGRSITINNGKKDYHYTTDGHGELHFPIRFTDQLHKHGIVCHKPDRVLAGIPDRHFNSAVLGFLDGDGSIIVRRRKDCRSPRLHINICSGAVTILSHIQKHLERKLGIASSIHARSNARCSDLRIETTKSSIKFCEWLYDSASSILCEKKKTIFTRYMSCVRSGEFGEGRKADNPEPSHRMVEGVETTGVPEVAPYSVKQRPTRETVKI